MTTQPSPEQRKQFFAGLFDRLADSYDNVGVEFFAHFGRRLVERTGLRPGDTVLDAGCGRGAVTLPAAEAVGERGRVEAIDISSVMVELTSQTTRSLANVTVTVGDAEAPDFPPASFDAVLSGLVIFFLPDPAAALRNYRTLLRDGGRLGLTTFPPQPDATWAKVGTVVQRYLSDAPVATRPDTSPLSDGDTLAAMVRDAGFGDVRWETEAFETGFRDLDQWWAWTWAQGQRAALERVPADRLPDLKAELYDLLAADTRPDGSLPLRQLVTYTVATA